MLGMSALTSQLVVRWEGGDRRPVSSRPEVSGRAPER